MGCLDRYIAWKLLQGWILIWLVVSAIFGLLTFIEELDRVTDHYQTLDALHFVLYTLPQRSMELAPVIILLGSLLALAGMNKNSEIIAIRAAGVSLARFFRSIVIPAIVLVITLYAISEFVAAPLYQDAEVRKILVRTNKANLLKGKGLWSNNGYSFFNVRTLKHSNAPRSIYLYEFDKTGRLLNFVYAGGARLNESRRWNLLDVRQKSLVDNRLRSQHLDHLEMGPFWSRDELPALPLSTSGMTPSGLYEYSGYLKSTQQVSERIEQLFWQRVSLPLTAGAMVLLATPIGAGLGTTRSSAFGKSLAIGAGVGILFYLLSQLIQTGGSIAGLPPELVAFLPVTLVVVATAILISRIR
ncbi:MAG: LPS export ABC transporter permease LptG [Thiogranum sp.]